MNAFMMAFPALLILLAGSSTVSAQIENAGDRSAVDPQVIAAGQKLFRRNCAVCHGWNAEGVVDDWRQTDAQGNYPPPPLNGTAHAWHHPKSQLTRVVKQGTARLGGNMPAFGTKLNEAQISATIDYLISLWSQDAYQAWLKRGGYD